MADRRYHPVFGRINRALDDEQAELPTGRSIDAIAERRIAEGRARGLFDDLPGAGKPIPDIDRRRRPGWWADRFVNTERRKLKVVRLEEDVAAAMAPLWRLETEPAVAARVGELNALIDERNGLTELAPMARLDVDDVVARWRRYRADRLPGPSDR